MWTHAIYRYQHYYKLSSLRTMAYGQRAPSYLVLSTLREYSPKRTHVQTRIPCVGVVTRIAGTCTSKSRAKFVLFSPPPTSDTLPGLCWMLNKQSVKGLRNKPLTGWDSKMKRKAVRKKNLNVFTIIAEWRNK